MKIVNFTLFKESNIKAATDKVLYIFDFDETLVLNPRFEELAIQYLTESVSIKSLLQTSCRRIGIKISDLKWENGRIYVKDPDKEIDVKFNWVRKGKRVYLIAPDKFYFTDMSLPVDITDLSVLYNHVENKAIVTGRHNDIKHKVSESLLKFSLDEPNHGLYCYPGRQQGSDKISDWKAKTIVKLIKKSGFNNAHFYDDNSKWVNKVVSVVKKELPNINFIGTKYRHQ